MFSSPLQQIISGRMDPAQFVALAVSLIVCITVHEFAHAAAATWLGDSLPGRQGRLTLSPIAHLDPVGSLLFLVGGFGWGRPVQYNPYALRAGPRSGPAIVALAGPLSNFIVAAGLALIARALPLVSNASMAELYRATTLEGALFKLFLFMILYNLSLGFFNLIPIAPLDGFTVLLGLLPPALAYQFEQTRQYGFMVLLAVMFLGGGLLGALLYGPINLFFDLLLGL